MKLRQIFFCSALFLVGVATGWLGKTARSIATAGQSLLSVPDVYQSTQYSCGASALQAVLAYWGIEVHEDTLLNSLGTTGKNGTSPENILRIARSYGLQAEIRENLSIANVISVLGKGVPVILDI